MEGQEGVGLERDDCPGEVVLAGEVVVDLRGLTPAASRTAGVLVPATPWRYMRSAAAATIRSRVARPFLVLGASCFGI